MQMPVTKALMPQASAEPKMLMGFDVGDDIYHLMAFDFDSEGGALGIWREGDSFVARISLDALVDFNKSAKSQLAPDLLSDQKNYVPAFVPNRNRFFKRSSCKETGMGSLTALTRDDTEHGTTYYLASEVDALLEKIPTRESVADDIGVLILNGDLPANMEDLADWVQAGNLPLNKTN